MCLTVFVVYLVNDDDAMPVVFRPVVMGSYGDDWLRCSWCGEWGCIHVPLYTMLPDCVFLNEIDGAGVLCDECFALHEPPVWPNNRQRCALWLQRMGLFPWASQEIFKAIAEWLAENDP